MKVVGMMVLVWFVCCCVSASALALSDGRVYEMVSPVYKEGYGVGETKAVQPEGDEVLFDSQGGFANPLSGGNLASHEYLARREPSGSWTTVSFEPAFGAVADVSADLEYGLASGPVGPNAGFENYASTEEVFQLHRSDAPDTVENWEIFGGMVLERLDKMHLLVIEEGASKDLCHLVLGRPEGALLPEAKNVNAEQLYDLSRDCGGVPSSLRLVGVTNAEAPTPISSSCPVELGAGANYVNMNEGKRKEQSAVNAIDGNGDEVFFTTNVQDSPGNCFSGGVHQLFARLGASKTIEVSRPLGGCFAKDVAGEVPCDGSAARPSSYFVGASEDGSKVFFTTSASLVGEDVDDGTDLYMATIGCPGSGLSETEGCDAARREMTSLVQISHINSESSQLQGVIRIAPDGSRIYFVARGAIGGGATSGPAPVQGRDNLYMYDSVTGHTAFVADLCSGPARSGEAQDVQCPHSLSEGADVELLWGLHQSYAQSTPDGSVLVFDSYGRLVPDDTDDTKDVYRYDAITKTLERVSIGEDGYDANGNGDGFDASIQFGTMGVANGWVFLQHEMATRAISADGSRVVFDTVAPLSPNAKNRRTNIYEWHDGAVSLISSGIAETNDAKATITSSGRDVIFTTSQGLVPQDSDGLPDIYDARIGGGEPVLPAARQPCSGDACQGPLMNPAPLLVPGSAVQSPGGNFPLKSSKPVVKKKKKKQKKRKTNAKKNKTAQKRNAHSSVRSHGKTGGRSR
jgi:hypothetical protein